MQLAFVLPHYLSWHYTRALRDGLTHVRTFFRFFWNLFSIAELFKTLFAPFERLGQAKPKQFNPEQYFEALATTLVMRVVGMVVRSFFIVLGIAVLVAWLLCALCFFVVWLLLPLMVLALIVGGVIALTQ